MSLKVSKEMSYSSDLATKLEFHFKNLLQLNEYEIDPYFLQKTPKLDKLLFFGYCLYQYQGIHRIFRVTLDKLMEHWTIGMDQNQKFTDYFKLLFIKAWNFGPLI